MVPRLEIEPGFIQRVCLGQNAQVDLTSHRGSHKPVCLSMNVDLVITITHITDWLGGEACIPDWNLFQDGEYITESNIFCT